MEKVQNVGTKSTFTPKKKIVWGTLPWWKMGQKFILGENTILILTFWGHNQFGPYILVTVNLVPTIFNLQPIWPLLLSH